MKKILVAAAFTLIPTLHAAPVVLEDSPIQPVAYVRLAPVPKTIIKVSQTLQAIKPGPQTAMVAAGLGLMLGDPGFTSFDPEANAAFYAFDNFNEENPPDFIVLLKLTPGSPAEQTIKKMELHISRHKGWTVLTSKPSVVKKIGNLDPLIAHSQSELNADLEVGVFAGALLSTPFLKAKIQEGLKELQKNEDKEGLAKSGAALAELVLEELGTLEVGKLQLTLAEKAIEVDLGIAAQPGSDLAKLFNSNAGGSVPEGALVERSGMFYGAYAYDPKAVLTYWDGLIKRAKTGTQGQVAKLLEQVDKMMQEALPLYAGTGAMAMNFDLSDPVSPSVDLVSVNATTSTDAQLQEYLKGVSAYTDALMKTVSQTFGTLLGEIGEKLDIADMIKHKVHVQENAFKVGGVAVHTLSQKVEVEGDVVSAETYHYAIAGGNLLAVTSKEGITELIQRVESGTKAKNPVSTELEKGTLMYGQFNPKIYLSLIFGAMTSAFDDSKESPFLEKLDKLQVEPWPIALKLGNNKSTTSITLSHASIRTMVEFGEKVTKVTKEMMKDFANGDVSIEDLADEPQLDLSKIEIPMDLEIQNSDGTKTTLAALSEGKKAVLLDFWATWCGPCMALMPELKQKAKKLGPQGIAVAGMNVEKGLKKAERTRKKLEIGFTWLVEPKGEPFSGPLQIDSIPRMVLISPEGKVLYNGHPQDPGLAEALAALGVKL